MVFCAKSPILCFVFSMHVYVACIQHETWEGKIYALSAECFFYFLCVIFSSKRKCVRFVIQSVENFLAIFLVVKLEKHTNGYSNSEYFS